MFGVQCCIECLLRICGQYRLREPSTPSQKAPEREAGDPEGNLMIVEKCACREAIRLPEAEGRAPKGPQQGAAVGRKRQRRFPYWEHGWDGSAHRFASTAHGTHTAGSASPPYHLTAPVGRSSPRDRRLAVMRRGEGGKRVFTNRAAMCLLSLDNTAAPADKIMGRPPISASGRCPAFRIHHRG